MGVGKTGSCGSSNTANRSTNNLGNPPSKSGSVSKSKTNTKGSYTVKPGDSLSHISKKLGTSVNSIMQNNPQIKDANRIYSGQTLNISAARVNQISNSGVYTVKPGDNLSKIAAKHNTTVGNLLRANPSAVNPRDLVYPGQKLNLPAAGQVNAAAPVKGNLKSKAVNVQLPAKGIGYTTYYSQADKYGTAQTIKNLQDIARDWNAKHPNDPIQIGDISKLNGRAYTNGEHVSHRKGVDVDMRPFSKNGKQGPVTIHDKNYNAELTRELVRDIKAKFPNAVIGFQDKVLLKEGLTQNWKNHANHLHIRFQ